MVLRLALLALCAAAALGQDTDGDGLSDFHERHKYFTDPAKADSDGDGTPDGDWGERREYAYSIRTVVLVMKPAAAICDDYQDARVLAETDDALKLEVVHYPLNTVADALAGNPDWRADAAGHEAELRPGPTANWDEGLRRGILEGLRAEGIDPAALDDRTLVERASAWLMKKARYSGDHFTGYFTHFPEGRPAVYPGLRDALDGYAKSGLSVEEQWERDLLAKQMFQHGQRGSCTSSAIYLTGCMRALGVPTRIVYCIPCIDPSDPEERPLLDGLRHHAVRRAVKQGMPSGGWCGHTFNEVWVGGRWRRLNYDRLGQNILDDRCFGLLTHVLTVRDWADADMAPTVGVRQGRSLHDDAFGHGNPYSTLELDDLFGPHGTIENPPVAEPEEWKILTITRILWYADRPAGINSTNLDPASGHVYVQVKENRDGSTRQYEPFYGACSKAFVLRAEGHPDVPIRAERGYWGSGLFYLRIEPDDLAQMARGAPYALVAENGEAACRWVVEDHVRLVRALGTLTLDHAVWSDSPELPAALRQAYADRLVVLARVREACTAAVFEEFTAHADPRFRIETPDAPDLDLRAAPGAVLTEKGERYLVLVPERAPGDLDGAVLVPRNEKGTSRWTMALPVAR